MGDLVTIRQYSSYQLAHLDVAKLADEGIESALHNENTSTMLPYLSGAIGGIQLVVEESNAERALEILGTEEEPDLEIEIPPDEALDRCPNCGSSDLSEKLSKWTPWWGIIFGLSSATLPVKNQVCGQCGHVWK